MRIAALVVGLVLSIISFFQSLAVSTLSSVSGELSDSVADKSAAENNSAAGGAGVLAALLMMVAAGLAIAKPKASAIVFGCAVPVWVLAATGTDFSDAYIWAVASAILAAMSSFGIKERAKAQQKKDEAFQANVIAAANALQEQQNESAQPSTGAGVGDASPDTP